MNFVSILHNQKLRGETRLDLTAEKKCMDAKEEISAGYCLLRRFSCLSNNVDTYVQRGIMICILIANT